MQTDNNTLVSKTAFLKFDQCAKAFYLYKKHYYLRDKPTREKELIFNRGHHVGRLAQQLYPGGTDVSLTAKNAQESLALTRELLEKKTPVIYEAALTHNNVLVILDILVYENGKYFAFEVKSSLKINDTYIKDACLQYYVARSVLPELEDFYLVNLDSGYELNGELDLKKLFRRRSIKRDAEKNYEFFNYRASQMLLTLERNAIPGVPIGRHCFSPYQCEFLSTCWKNIYDPKSIFNLGKVGREQLFEWYDAGIQTVDKIEHTEELKSWIKIQAESISSEKEYINIPAVKEFLGTIKAPYCFMDMEIWSPAVPVYQGTRPFGQIPFLFSVCYSEDNRPVFKNYLKPVEQDGREEFLKQVLKETAPFKSVIVYDKNLEAQVLAALKNLYPQYGAEVDALLNRLLDISDIILNFHYYHPAFKGSFSLKAVAEIIEDYTLQPEISSGIIAMYAYESLLNESNPLIAENTKQQLIEYCNSDTEISLRFLNFLKEKVND